MHSTLYDCHQIAYANRRWSTNEKHRNGVDFTLWNAEWDSLFHVSSMNRCRYRISIVNETHNFSHIVSRHIIITFNSYVQCPFKCWYWTYSYNNICSVHLCVTLFRFRRVFFFLQLSFGLVHFRIGLIFIVLRRAPVSKKDSVRLYTTIIINSSADMI